jgi:hypothetical protein
LCYLGGSISFHHNRSEIVVAGDELSVLLPPNKKSAVERRPIDNGKENTQQPKKMRQSRAAAASGWIGSALEVTTGSADPTAYVNATPLGMIKDDPLPLAVDRISPWWARS